MKIKNIFCVILLITISILFISTSFVYAKSVINPNDYKPTILKSNDYDVVFNKTKSVVTILTTVGVVVSIVGTIALGIRYMMGSVEQRAEYKNSMIPMIIGMFLIFSSSVIISILYNIGSQINEL